MQANGSTTESTTGGVGASGNEEMPDIAAGQGAIHPSGSPANPGVQVQQSHQSQLRTSTSPARQQYHQQSTGQGPVIGQGVVSVHVGGHSGFHNHGTNYQQRHSYHNHQQQHHHHHQHQQPVQHYQNHMKYNNHRGDNESNVNHVLLITVINPHYTITCDLIHQICSSYGKVNRLVIFKKNGVQAMVEFDNVESAKRAKAMLHGCDIYSGCCTLRIEYAKPTKLNVHKNDSESFDYTNPNLGPGRVNEIGPDGEEQLQAGQTSHHGQQQHSPQGAYQQPHSGHHSRIGGSGERSGSGGSSAGGSGSHSLHHAHHHYQQPHHHQQQHQHNPHQHLQSPASVSQHGAYGPSAALDQPPGGSSNESFHQDGGFNVSRGSVAPNYVGGDSYLPPHGPVQGSIYSRHESHHSQPQHHHHHHQSHHHTRSNLGNNPNHSSSFSSANTSQPNLGGPSSSLVQGTVMMVYGLHPERVNCDRLFNLFCLYGNVVRVKFLRTKEGCAMVQMGDVLAVDRCVSSLNKITLFGNELQISYSKQAFLHDVMQPFILPDGSPSFKDFMGNKNNRFKNPEVASKNRILPPSHVLHFFNAPYGITEEELLDLFRESACHGPVSLKIFTPRVENSKSFSGLVTFKDSVEATESLVICNHLAMPKTGAQHPYILRLCFSPPTYMRPSYVQPSQ